jgi:two-component system, response regulator PdtaR
MTVIDDAVVERPPMDRARRDILVMIVDDMAPLRDIIAVVLQDAGFDTIGARNGAEAIQLLAAGVGPSVILLDVVMPVMDAWEFLDTARPHVPVILMSGSFAERAAPLPDCVVGKLDKPVYGEMLLEAVSAALLRGSVSLADTASVFSSRP